jgi:hypothetical protein
VRVTATCVGGVFELSSEKYPGFIDAGTDSSSDAGDAAADASDASSDGG